MMRYPLVVLMVAMLFALAVATFIVEMGLNPPARDIQLLVLFMLISGVSTVLISYWLYERGLLQQFSSLRWTLVASSMITVLLVLLNVWITARLMFISQHDFVLTSALLAFAGLTALIFGLFVASMVTMRIRELSEAAEQVAEGKLNTRLDVYGQDELADFARTFNWMASSLEQLDLQKRQMEQARRDLIAGVSHDLRTPLTAMRVMLEAIQDEIVSDRETIRQYIENSLGEIGHLSHLIDDLFELARHDAGQVDHDFMTASLRDLISDSIGHISAQADLRGLKLIQNIAPDLDPVCMMPHKLQRVLLNLVDNALRYTPQGGQITISAAAQGEHIWVSVHNTGSVIDPIHFPHLFTTFYRIETSRTYADDGHRSTGLGLAIAKRYVDAHQGEISVQSSVEDGTTFKFTIPRHQRGAAVLGA